MDSRPRFYVGLGPGRKHLHGWVTTSEEDEAIREQLGALGYLE